MVSSDKAMALGQASRIGIECCDCGRNRWKIPSELTGRGITLHSSLSELSKRLSCAACKSEGLPGKNVSVQVWFDRDHDRTRAEAEVLRSQVALSVGSRAKCS
jgi:hypothetical protein